MTNASTVSKRLSARQRRIFSLLDKLRTHNKIMAYLFIADAFALCHLRQLIDVATAERQLELEQIGKRYGFSVPEDVTMPDPVPTFWQEVADPANHFGSSTRVALQLQTISLYWLWAKIDRVKLYGVGRAKFGLLNPEVELLKAQVEAGKLPFAEARKSVLEWLTSAETLSVSDLQALLLEKTIAYNGGDQTTAGQQQALGGFTTLCSTPMLVGKLRHMDRAALLDFLGISDQPDTARVIIEVRTRTSPTDGS